MHDITTTIIDELYAHNDWANDRLLTLCDGLTDGQLDQQRPIGLGSLRATLWHLLRAERLWLNRWRGGDDAPPSTPPPGVGVDMLREDFREISESRDVLLDEERGNGFSRVVEYRRTPDEAHAHVLGDLLAHVANHAIHHRAQALHYLKGFGRTVPAGLDYLFFKLAYPTTEQLPESVEALTAYGLECNRGQGATAEWDQSMLQRLFAYNDWAMQIVMHAASPMDDEALDREWEMGMGSIRKSLLHLCDAERWWGKSWTEGPVDFERLPHYTTLDALQSLWKETASGRDEFRSRLDAEQSRRVVTVQAGNLLVRYRVIESLIQLVAHGTHHRAQVVNMLRRSGAEPIGVDYVVWLRQASDGGRVRS